MTTRLDIAKWLGGARASATSDKFGGSTTSSSTLYGYALEDASNESGTWRVLVRLDSGVEGTFNCDQTIKEGDRVKLVYMNGSYFVMPVISNAIDEAVSQAGSMIEDERKEIDDAITEAGNQIKQEVEQELDGVREEVEQTVSNVKQEIIDEVNADVSGLQSDFEDFKTTHTLTDDDITREIVDTKTELSNTITGVIETENERYEAQTQLSQTVDQISATASEKYEEYDKGIVELGASVAINSQAIATEVTNRTQAVSGALTEAKSYTDQTAESISQSVSQTYQTKDGMSSYATNSYVDQTASELRSEIEEKLVDVDENVLAEAKSYTDQTATSLTAAIESTYQTKAGMVEYDTKISALEGEITTEVSDRVTAVSGALAEAKSYTDQTASSISQSVANTYQTKDGMSSYATTSYVDQTSEDITTTFTKSLATKGKTYTSQPAPPYYVGDVWVDAANGIAYVCKTQRLTGSYTSSDWTASSAFLSTFIVQDTNGITVGNSVTGYKARVNASGYFDILDSSNSTILRVSADSEGAYITSVDDYVRIYASGGDGMLTVGQGYITLSASYGVRMTGSSLTFSVTQTSGGYVIAALPLYINAAGISGTLSLSVSLASRKVMWLEIGFVDGSGRRYSQRVFLNGASSATTSIFRAVHSSAVMYTEAVVLTISGSTITQSLQGSANVAADGNTMTTSSNIKITYVIGWIR